MKNTHVQADLVLIMLSAEPVGSRVPIMDTPASISKVKKTS